MFLKKKNQNIFINFYKKTKKKRKFFQVYDSLVVCVCVTCVKYLLCAWCIVLSLFVLCVLFVVCVCVCGCWAMRFFLFDFFACSNFLFFIFFYLN